MAAKPTITIRPQNFYLQTNNSLAVTNPENFTGEADGSKATFAASNTIGNSGDVYRFGISVIPQLQNAFIDGFEYTFKSISASGTVGSDEIGLTLRPFDEFGVDRGRAEGVHEFFSTPIDAGTATYVNPLTADGHSLFTSSANSIGQNCLRFANLGGFNVYTTRYGAGSGSSVLCDALELVVYYTPEDPGASILRMLATAVSEVDAATAGVALPGGATEVAWTNPANTLSTDSSRGTASGINSAAAQGVTKFLRYTIPAGALIEYTASTPNELRLRVRQYQLDQAVLSTDGYVWPHSTIEDIVVCKTDGTIVAQLSDNDLYGARTYKVCSYGISSGTPERDRIYAVDVSAITAAELADMNTNGFYVYVRWALPTSVPTDNESSNRDWITLGVNSCQFTMSFGTDPNGAEGSGSSGRLGRLQRV